jgi:hypothetical protein
LRYSPVSRADLIASPATIDNAKINASMVTAATSRSHQTRASNNRA